jgi:hypothetical protein
MSGAVRTYTDRFGHVWEVRFKRGSGAARYVTFTCGEFQLVAAEEEATGAGHGPTGSQLKELFCDAERVLAYENEVWYVSYRHRAGKGRVHAGLYTRFRSAADEVRYSPKMLQFRQMTEDDLCQHLASARPVVE